MKKFFANQKEEFIEKKYSDTLINDDNLYR